MAGFESRNGGAREEQGGMGKEFAAYGDGFSGDTSDLSEAEGWVKTNRDGAVYRRIKTVCHDCHGSGVGLTLPTGEPWPCRMCLGQGLVWAGPRSDEDVVISAPRWVFDCLIVGAQMEHARRREERPKDQDSDRFEKAWRFVHRAVNLVGE